MSEKFSKRDADRAMGPNDKFDDGTTLAQRANMRAIYENPEAYDEWRIGMGLKKPPDVSPNFQERRRVSGLFGGLVENLGRAVKSHPKDAWMPEPARKLSLDELGEMYRKESPRLTQELQGKLSGYSAEMESRREEAV